MHRHAAVSLADLAAAGVRLRPTDAVTIVGALVRQIEHRLLPGVPSAHVIRLSTSGEVSVEGPVVATGMPVPRAGVRWPISCLGPRDRGPTPHSRG